MQERRRPMGAVRKWKAWPLLGYGVAYKDGGDCLIE